MRTILHVGAKTVLIHTIEFRHILVAFGRGGGGGNAARDMAALFDLELDTEKNQYEARQPAATTPKQKAQEVADILKKRRRSRTQMARPRVTVHFLLR